jgi:hypothetical protein
LAFLGYQYRECIFGLISNPPQLDINYWIQNLTLDNILAFIQKYGVLITGAAAAFSFIYGLYKNSQTNKALQELAMTKQTADTEINTAYGTAEQYRLQAESYKLKYEEAAKNESSDALLEAQNLVINQNKIIDNLKATVTYQNGLIEQLKVATVEKKVVK